MMWLWLSLTWFVVACAAGVWLGAAMRAADRCESVASDAERWLRLQTAEHQPG